MEAEAIPPERVDPAGGSRVFGWLRERLMSQRTLAEQAVDEAVEASLELTSPYPAEVGDAVIGGLDEGFQLGTGETITEEQAIGFADERRPTMIMVGEPITPNLIVYRLEVQRQGRYQEMELIVAGTGQERQLLKAATWIEEHPPGHHQAVVTEHERPMEVVELLKLAGDLDGRVRDGTFREVSRTWDVRR